MTELQVLVTTHNEERNLPDCLASVAGWTGRTLVVDSFSRDDTAQVAAEAGADFIQREYLSPADQKNWALDQLDPGWVLILDADERVSAALREEIETVLDTPEHEAYWIPRRSRFLGKEIRHAGWDRDGVTRLIKRDAGRYRDALVHEVMECRGSVGRLAAPLEHESYHDVDDYLERMLRYSRSGARQMHREGRRAGAAKILFRPLFRFLRMFVWQCGWRDGRHGFLLCALSGLQVGIKHALHWALSRGLMKDVDDR
jgi:glycosyltransferase involved in cell wall biosynthesis